MGAIAQIENGKVVETASQTSIKETAKKSGSTMDKDAFLGLLVAQMKYQDPLEPTSNTEFVAQYAQFSSLEQMQNMSATLELSRASMLVGQTVNVNTTDSMGMSTLLQGRVDYVTYENGRAYVSIGGQLFSLDDVTAVADQEYLDAYDLATQFGVAMNKLPSYESLSLEDKEAIDALCEIYNGMSSYEQTFVASDFVTKLELYAKRMQDLVDDLVGDFTSAMDKLPGMDKLTLEDKAKIDELNKMYEEMDDYKKGFVDESYVTMLEEYTEKMEELAGNPSTEDK